jgi:hypothetical protein
VTTTTIGRRGRARARGLAAVIAAAASTVALAACGSASPAPSAPSAAHPTAQPAAASGPAAALATSLSTVQDSWAIVPASADPTFSEVLVRPATSATWRLVTPPGVADNGGLVAAGDAGSALTVAVRPSRDLHFTPVTSTADAGASWSTDGPIGQAVASSPGALAVSGRQLAALLSNGAIEASANGGGTWRTLARPGTIAASAAGKKCGTVKVTSVAFGPGPTEVLAAGRCGATGADGLFSYTTGGGWQRLGLPVTGQLVRLSAGSALVRAKAGLTVLWDTHFGWYAYAPLATPAQPSDPAWSASAPLPVSSAITASGGLAGATPTSSAGAWVLLPGGQAATIAGPGKQWLLLPPTPAHTTVLASGPGTSIDALAVSGDNLTVWQLDHGSTLWAKEQTISVPVQPGMSS